MNNTVCDIPPPGWLCSRAKGHEGPCAASSTAQVNDRALELLAAVDLALEEDGPWLQLQKDIREYLRANRK